MSETEAEERCEMSDLLASACSHCTGDTDRHGSPVNW